MQKRANRANQLVLFFLAGANFWEKHAKNRQKHAQTGENTRKQAKNRRKTGAFLVLIFLWEKLVGANFYAFCNYDILHIKFHQTTRIMRNYWIVLSDPGPIIVYPSQ